jgi:hypothetical protein
MDVEAEIRDLKRRVGELEGGFAFLVGQVQSAHRDLLGLQSQANQRFDKVDGRLDRMDGHLIRLEAEVQRLRQGLPSVVGDAVREALRQATGEQPG